MATDAFGISKADDDDQKAAAFGAGGAAASGAAVGAAKYRKHHLEAAQKIRESLPKPKRTWKVWKQPQHLASSQKAISEIIGHQTKAVHGRIGQVAGITGAVAGGLGAAAIERRKLQEQGGLVKSAFGVEDYRVAKADTTVAQEKRRARNGTAVLLGGVGTAAGGALAADHGSSMAYHGRLIQETGEDKVRLNANQAWRRGGTPTPGQAAYMHSGYAQYQRGAKQVRLGRALHRGGLAGVAAGLGAGVAGAAYADKHTARARQLSRKKT